MSDQKCTQCHADLTAHTRDRAPLVAETVTQFDADPTHHPEFRFAHSPDPGHLRFNHARHLTPGMALKEGGPVQTLKMIRDPADRARYQRFAHGSDGTITLDCAACHQLDRGAAGADATSAPAALSSRMYMMPVNYANHCRACHPLDYDPAAPAMEHGLQPAEVHARLWRTYAAAYLEENPALLDQRIPPRPMPGRSEAPALVEAREAVQRKVCSAEKILFGGKKCGECHKYETAGHEPVAVLEAWEPSNDVRITPANIQTVWWRSARFDHSAHAGVSCRSCHERAYPDSAAASQQSKDILLPTIDDCVQCHAPRRPGAAVGEFTGGAGFDCTECHRYHNADPVLGLPPPPGAAEPSTTIRQFLLGAPARPPNPTQ
jgi:hypothetical protein